MKINYVGEQLLWGQLGHFFVVLAFVTAVFSVIANVLRVRNPIDQSAWKITARSLYITHAVAVIGIFVTLLLMIIAHRFEYQYVWQHSKRDMKMNYVLACLWEGQEGSTLLWLFWHSIIGLVLMRRAKEWEAPVMSVLSLVQVFLSMMLLGFFVGKVHIGSNPFELMRLKESNIGLPWTKIPDYLTKIPLFHDGRGLNPLLQNYWMTIHPPTLFLGFALVTVPFAFAVAGLWTKRYYDWQKPALTWAYIGVMVLGTGILMGGAWAYESLSFGGFWAWDPVENASLVPWLVLVGAAHVMLLYRNKGQSLFTTFFLCIVAFLLIVYSTFLTKSGILSDTSVHAFTDDGLNEELTVFMGFFLWLAVFLLAFNWRLRIIYTAVAVIVLVRFLMGYHAASMLLLLTASVITIIIGYLKYFPVGKDHKEEELWSREFWMFIGSLVLFAAASQIIYYTSSPVVNKFLKVESVHSFWQWLSDSTHMGWTKTLSEARLAPGSSDKVVLFYNKWQIPFAFVVCLLMAVSQFFKYKSTDMKTFLRQLRRSFIISAAITFPLVLLIYFNASYEHVNADKKGIYIICSFLLFATIFTITANGDYWLKVLKGKISKAGASIAHLGFGFLVLGIVISTSKKDTISTNTSRFDISSFTDQASNADNIYLKKGDTLKMGDYFVTYRKRERIVKDGTPYFYFRVDFLNKKDNGKMDLAFTLSPFIQLNPFMGNAAEPDTRHYLHKDIYTFVKFVEPSSLADTVDTPEKKGDLFDKPVNHTIAVGDTIALDNAIAVLDHIDRIDSTNSLYNPEEYGISANFKVFDGTMTAKFITAYYFINKNSGVTRQLDGIDEDLGLKFTFWKVRPENNKIDVYSTVKLSKKADFIVMEASIFPGINILWIGCLIMVTGTFLAVRERKRKNKLAEEENKLILKKMPENSLQRLRVILIGSGNVATNLAYALLSADAEIVQVYSRKEANAKILAKKVKAKVITDLSKIDKRPALIIIAVKDDAIAAVAKKIKVADGIVVHTSGSVSMDVLKKFDQYGVLYPLQTFSKTRIADFRNVPMCIEGSDISTLQSLTTVAETLSDCVYNLDSKQRQAAHLAAVFANNFTNHLYAISEDLLNDHKLPFDLIRPLIDETAVKVMDISPAAAQTGPAIRNDKVVMKNHLALLKKHPEMKKLYSEFSAGILKRSKRRKK